jgi:hypothetical protein
MKAVYIYFIDQLPKLRHYMPYVRNTAGATLAATMPTAVYVTTLVGISTAKRLAGGASERGSTNGNSTIMVCFTTARVNTSIAEPAGGVGILSTALLSS